MPKCLVCWVKVSADDIWNYYSEETVFKISKFLGKIRKKKIVSLLNLLRRDANG